MEAIKVTVSTEDRLNAENRVNELNKEDEVFAMMLTPTEFIVTADNTDKMLWCVSEVRNDLLFANIVVLK